MFSFDPPENIRKPNVFRGIKREHWEEKGQDNRTFSSISAQPCIPYRNQSFDCANQNTGFYMKRNTGLKCVMFFAYVYAELFFTALYNLHQNDVF